MNRATLLSVGILLALLGLADALYLANAALTHSVLTCDIAGLSGCNVVAQSPYSRYFGVPLGVYGTVFYAVMLGIAFIARYRPSRGFDRIFSVLALGGALASVYFMYVQLAIIKAVCIYCLASAAIAFLLVGVALSLRRNDSSAPSSPDTAP